jgi:hypothetical protein
MRFITMIEAGDEHVGESPPTGGAAPRSSGARVRPSGARIGVTDGPFAETKEHATGCAVRPVNPAARGR